MLFYWVMQFVAYYRVSTQKQGRSGLGLAAQKDAVARHLKTTSGKLIASFQEIESGTKSDDERLELHEALALAKKSKATLLIAKLDRLTRDPEFLFKLQNSGQPFVCCDMPEADKFTVGIMAVMAQKERDDLSRRTKAALDALKAKGVKLGGPNINEARKKAIKVIVAKKKERASKVIGIIDELKNKAHVKTLAGLAECLNLRGIPTPRNGKWTATSVSRAMTAAA